MCYSDSRTEHILTPVQTGKKGLTMNFLYFLLKLGSCLIAFVCLVVLGVGLVKFGADSRMTVDQVDDQVYALVKIEPSSWTGEVVKSEQIGHGFYKVLVRRTGSEKRDTLFATTDLAVGSKVQYLNLITLDHNNLPQTMRLAVPVPAPALEIK